MTKTRRPERIWEVTRLLREAWKRYPDMRLGQLITNAHEYGIQIRKRSNPDFSETDLWDTEEDIFMLGLKEMIRVSPMHHNHVTRDIKPLGECPKCDRYHERNKDSNE